MKTYMVKFENRPNWNTENDLHDDSQWVVTEEELKQLAIEWGMEQEELLEQVEEI